MMKWLIDLFTEQTFIQAVLIISLVCSMGLALGNIKAGGVSLGSTFVFFIGIIAGHLGLSIDAEMLLILQNFGLILFIYALGVQVGPGFFSSFKKGGVRLNLLAVSVLIVGTALALGFTWITDISVYEMTGLLSGAVTNTPMLGAAQQAVLQINPDAVEQSNNMAMACAVGYPFGLIGVILCVIILKTFFLPKNQKKSPSPTKDNTFITEYQICNPEIFGKSIKDIRENSGCQFVISRVWKNNQLIIPTGETILEKDEHILVISGKKDVELMKSLFGQKEEKDWNKKDIDWNAIDSQLSSKKILVTKPELNGIKLGTLRLRNSYGINITRVNRAGIDLLPNRSLRLQLGDRITVVGEARSIENVCSILGNEAKQLRNPNLVTIFAGIALGLILGSIPFMLPGISIPVKLGIAGGPIIVGLLMGAFGPRFHLTTYTTQSANLMLRQIGITIYLAGLGLSAGDGFFETVLTGEGLKWIAISTILAIVPVLLVGYIASAILKVDYAKNVGMLCASMSNPIALNYANSTVEGDEPSVAYATVYPFIIFLRVISAQIIILIFG